MFKLTERGEDAAQNVNMKQKLESRVVAFMFMAARPVELEEIQDEIRISDEMTVTLLKRMESEGLIVEV